MFWPRERSRWFGFTDDIVIRVTPAGDGAGGGSRVDLRSESRQGRSDFVVNAARVRAYLASCASPEMGEHREIASLRSQ